MSEQREAMAPVAPPSTRQRGGLVDGVRQLAYAWIGLWSVARGDLCDFYGRCVERGEQIMNARPSAARLPVKPQMEDMGVSQPRTASSRAIRPTSIFNAFGAVESYHFDLNADQLLPTKAEFYALRERVEALSREVDALADRREP